MAVMGAMGYALSKFLSAIPQIKAHMLVVRMACIALCILGIFMYGGAGVAAIYQARVQELQNKINVAEQASKDVTHEVQTRVVEHTKIIRKTKTEYLNRIQVVEKQLDAECPGLGPDVVKILNQAARNPFSDYNQ
jgi:hypothetical protein